MLWYIELFSVKELEYNVTKHILVPKHILLDNNEKKLFLECYKCGYFVTSIFSDIIIRDKKFKILKKGQRGLVQLLSLLPTSYPGHNILTEDVGEIIGEDNCKCGLKGKYFVLHGRAKEAEVRGCSDAR